MYFVMLKLVFILILFGLTSEQLLKLTNRMNKVPGSTQSLAELLKHLTERELSNCTLSLFGTKYLKFELILTTLRNYSTSFTTPIQAFDDLPHVDMISKRAFEKQVYSCNAYIFFLPDFQPSNSSFVQFLNSSNNIWNYEGKVIFVSQVKDQLDNWLKISMTYKVKKTTDTLAIWLSKTTVGYEIWSNWPYNDVPLRKLATYRHSEDLKKIPTLFPEKYQDFKGFTLVVKTFSHPPSVFGNADGDGTFIPYGGVDVRTIQTISEALNFTLVWKHPGPDLWGLKLNDSTHTGLVGQIGTDDGDVGVANMFVTLERAAFLTFTYPYDFEKACFVTPSPRERPHWLSITYPFNFQTWLIISWCLCALSVILFLFVKLQVAQEVIEFKRSSMYVLAVFTSSNPRHFATSVSLRLLAICIGLMGFLLDNCYSGNLTACLSVKTYEQPITTIEELYNSRYPLFGFSNWWRETFSTASNEYSRLLTSRYVDVSNLSPEFESVANRRGTLIENLEYLKFIVAKHFTTKTGESPLRVQEECFASYTIAALLSKHSPLKPSFDKVILHMEAGGLVNKFFQEILSGNFNDSIKFSWLNQHGHELTSPDDKVLTVYHFLGAFAIYCVGIVISFLVFSVEVLKVMRMK